jgi:hypothetical protein
MVHIKAGDVFDYPFWGKCVMSYENGVLVCKALDAGSDGSKTWKCNSASDTEKLIDGQEVNVSWDREGKPITEDCSMLIMMGHLTPSTGLK